MTEEEVFMTALDLPDAAARDAYLDEACGTNSAYRRQVDALLANHFRSGEFLDVPVAEQIKAGSTDDKTISVGGTGGKDPADADDLAFLSPSTRPGAIGRIGHYDVLQVLGKGGFGIVFRAFDDMLQRVVAVKVMSPQIATLSPARKRFVREARSSAPIRHENVVQVYEVGEQPLPYLVMEFIPGETLQQKLDRTGPLDVPEVVRIGRQVADGLAAAHANDLIHRDIKPSNILMESGPQGRGKITDFGLARAADDASISQSGIVAGTPMFMAPEQALGDKLDQRADLFSLGSVLYQMASGRPPFRAPTMVAVLKRVAEDPARDIREIIPETPPWLCAIIAKLHAKDPADRYQSAREVADVLADCEAQLKANAKLQDFSRIPRPKSASPRKWKWAAAPLALLPVIALAVTEFAGVTHLWDHGQLVGTVPPILEDRVSTTDVAGPTPPLAAAPFDAAQARAHQDAWAAHLGVPAESTNDIGMKFRLIPPGEFMMGDDANAQPQHKVKLTRPILLAVHEVTVGQFRAFVEATGYKTGAETSGIGGDYWDFQQRKLIQRPEVTWATPPFEQAADYPVCCVTWNDARKFCDWLSRKDGRTYSLPTEAQWEFACRAGTTTQSPFGDDLDATNANISTGVMRPCAVGSFTPNAFGLYDMIGNVYEWCQDDVRPYGPESAIDPTGLVRDTSRRANRGGAYSSSVEKSRSASRSAASASRAYAGNGFRVADVGDLRSRGPAAPDAKATVATAPFTDADVRRIAALPVTEQIAEVRKELMKRNPKFDGFLMPTIKDTAVTGLVFSTLQVTDISPVRSLPHLKSLQIRGQTVNGNILGSLLDLSPLKGMALTHLDLQDSHLWDLTPLRGMPLESLNLWNWAGSDLSPLKGMPLKQLNCGGRRALSDLSPLAGLPLEFLCVNFTDVSALSPLRDMPLTTLMFSNTPVSDLTPLRGMRLQKLCFVNCPVADLAPIRGMPLTEMQIEGSAVADLSGLKDLPLKHLKCDFRADRDTEILRAIKSLETINGKPADEFLKGLKEE